MLRIKIGYVCSDIRAIKEETEFSNRQMGDKLGMSAQMVGYLLKGDLRKRVNKKYSAAITAIIESLSAPATERPPMNEIKPFEPRTMFDLQNAMDRANNPSPTEIRSKISEMTKRGFRSKEISEQLGMSIDSVRAYMANETRRDKKLKAGLVRMKQEMSVPTASKVIGATTSTLMRQEAEDLVRDAVKVAIISPLAQSVLKMLTADRLNIIAVRIADEIRDSLLQDDIGLRRINSVLRSQDSK